MSASKWPWAKHFQIQSDVELDFVIGQSRGWPVGMSRESPPEFRRRVLAASTSYLLQLSSIDYALKRYVEPALYENEELSLGDEVSDYIRDSVGILMKELFALHAPDPEFGVFGAELTLYKIPHAIDAARMMSNRGLLLEVLPILRLCQEMAAWAGVAYHQKNEDAVVALRAQSCISAMKGFYPSAGKIYGYLSSFSHWGHVVHGQFLDDDPDSVSVLRASVRYRAMALSLCLVVLDVFVASIRSLYGSKSDTLVAAIQGNPEGDARRNIARLLSKVLEATELEDIREIESFLS